MTDISHTPGPLLNAAQNTDTCLWNDSSDLGELKQSITFGAVGATCNPVIAYTTIQQNLDAWRPRIQAIADANPTWGESQIGWQAVKDMSVEAAELLKDSFTKHKGRNGRLSVQTDPRLHRDAQALADQAVEFHQMAENIVVKIPATKTGVEAIEDATYRGVSINVTVSFSVPQAVRAAEAIERGLERREAEGHDVSEVGAVVTIMVGRLDDWLKHVVERDGLDVDPESLEWGGVACFKKAYQIFRERGFRSRLLSAAFRSTKHWSEFVGGDVVVSPPFKWQETINAAQDLDGSARMDQPVAREHLDQLMKIEDFRRAYEVDGMSVEEFDQFGPTRKTLRQFLQADADLDALVRDIIVPAP